VQTVGLQFPARIPAMPGKVGKSTCRALKTT
jgi:hypothetical protein